MKHIFALVGIASVFASTTAWAAPKPMAAKDAVQVQTALSGAGAAEQETGLGNLVADAVRRTGAAEAAIVPADEIIGSVSIPAGRTDAGKIVAALRYADDPSDTVVVLNLSGAQLLKIAERSVSRAPEPFDGFLQVSGLQIRYSPGQPEGKRVSLVGVGGGEVDAAKTYKVATTRPLVGGSLGYFSLLNQKDIAEDTGVSIAGSLQNYLSVHPVVSSTVEGRITTH